MSYHQGTRPTLVVGHQRLDTDSAVSAMVHAALLNSIFRDEKFEGVVLGKLSAQAKWLVARKKQFLPEILKRLGNKI